MGTKKPTGGTTRISRPATAQADNPNNGPGPHPRRAADQHQGIRAGTPKGVNYYVTLTSPTRTAESVLAVLDELGMKHPKAIVRVAGAVIRTDQTQITVAVNLADSACQPARNRRVGAAATAYLADLLDNLHQHHPRSSPAPDLPARKTTKTLRDTLYHLNHTTNSPQPQPAYA